MYIYIYTYIYRERERQRCIHIYIYIYVYIYIVCDMSCRQGKPAKAAGGDREAGEGGRGWDHPNPPHPHQPLFDEFAVLLCKSDSGPYLIHFRGGWGGSVRSPSGRIKCAS